MPYVQGFLKTITVPGGPDNELPDSPGHPSTQPLPPNGPVDPGYGYPLPPVIENGLPDAPGVWPPQKPDYPVDPDYGLPTAPGVWPQPPVHVWPPQAPVLPTHPIYPGGVGPSHPIALPPGSVWPPLPPSIQGVVLCFVWIVGVGYRWTVIDPSLHIDNKPPVNQTPQPKR